MARIYAIQTGKYENTKKGGREERANCPPTELHCERVMGLRMKEGDRQRKDQRFRERKGQNEGRKGGKPTGSRRVLNYGVCVASRKAGGTRHDIHRMPRGEVHFHAKIEILRAQLKRVRSARNSSLETNRYSHLWHLQFTAWQKFTVHSMSQIEVRDFRKHEALFRDLAKESLVVRCK